MGNETHTLVLMSSHISKSFLDAILNQNDPNKEQIIVYYIYSMYICFFSRIGWCSKDVLFEAESMFQQHGCDLWPSAIL